MTFEQFMATTMLPAECEDERVLVGMRLAWDTGQKQTAQDICNLIDIKTAITGGGNQYHIAAPSIKWAIKERYGI